MVPVVHLSGHEYLIYLEPDEVTDPLKALERVFTVTDMPDCRDQLKRWFQAAFSEGYAGDLWLPGNLLMLYKQVLCLMECTYLLRIRPMNYIFDSCSFFYNSADTSLSGSCGLWS